MSHYAIAIIEFNDITPGGREPGGRRRPQIRHIYDVSDKASLIPIILDYRDDPLVTGYRDLWEVDGCTEPPRIAEPVIVNGSHYGPSTAHGAPAEPVALDEGFATLEGDFFFTVQIGGDMVGLTGLQLPRPGQSFTVVRKATGGAGLPCFADGPRTWTCSRSPRRQSRMMGCNAPVRSVRLA